MSNAVANSTFDGSEEGPDAEKRLCYILEVIGIGGGSKKKKKKKKKKRMWKDGESEEGEEEEEEQRMGIHATALDELVSVNSFFTGAVFIGLSLSNDKSLVAKGPGDPCMASKHLLRQLVLLEVMAFSCFLMSSLVAQALKLHLTICSFKLRNSKGTMVIATHPRALRLGVLATALGSVGGTVFLMLSIVIVIQLRLGVLACHSTWSKLAAIPLLVLGSSGKPLCPFSWIWHFSCHLYLATEAPQETLWHTLLEFARKTRGSIHSIEAFNELDEQGYLIACTYSLWDWVLLRPSSRGHFRVKKRWISMHMQEGRKLKSRTHSIEVFSEVDKHGC